MRQEGREWTKKQKSPRGRRADGRRVRGDGGRENKRREKRERENENGGSTVFCSLTLKMHFLLHGQFPRKIKGADLCIVHTLHRVNEHVIMASVPGLGWVFLQLFDCSDCRWALHNLWPTNAASCEHKRRSRFHNSMRDHSHGRGHRCQRDIHPPTRPPPSPPPSGERNEVL